MLPVQLLKKAMIMSACVACGVLLVYQSALLANPVDLSRNGTNQSWDSKQPVLKTQAAPIGTLPSAPSSGGSIQLTVQDAILLALEHNRALRVQRIEPSITRTFEDEERAVFDPAVTAGITGSRERGEQVGTGGEISRERTEEVLSIVAISKFFSTGTTIGVDFSTESSWSNLYSDQHQTRVGVTITQALLRGLGTDVNLARVRQAALDTRASQYELRGFTESLVSSVEETYWDYALARRQIEIVTESLKVAEQQLKETEIRIRVGKLPEIELAAAQAEVALRREALIEARSTLEQTHLLLLRLINPPGPKLWEREIVLQDRPIIPDTSLADVESHVQVALRMRPDLNQARLEIQRGDLEIVQTKNGLLPKMDFFITAGKTGYADSFGDSVRDLDGKGYDALAGLTFEYFLGNRAPEARHHRALLDREQSVESLDNLVQLVEVDVRAAFIEVNRAREQVAATAATRKFSEETVRAETEKFRVGKSTSFLVGRAQRDLLVSQIAEIRAVANYLKAYVELYRLEGSLLERRGISVPGREPVELSLQR